MAFNFNAYREELLFVPLGGSNEIGMNLNCYHYQGKWLLVDMGIGFADDHLPGVEVLVPDIEFLMENKEHIVGLVITHAHEDHLGAVPYLWRDLDCPIYTTPFTAAFLKYKLTENGVPYHDKIHEVAIGSTLQLAPFDLEFVSLTHSIPEMQAIAIRTPKGTIMHTGDWKLDADPLIGPVSDEDAMKRYGDEGVLAMMCDSTNVFVEGESGSEGDVRRHLFEVIKECKNRVVVTTFASNLARVESIILAGHDAGRVIVLAGRSLWRIVEAAKQSGYLPENIEFVSDKEAMNLPRQDALIICTGSQGEPLAALTKISRGEHPAIRLSPGDTVVFASRKIPGNDKRIAWVQNSLVQRGIDIITDSERFVHVSGHPARGELARMYQLVRPQIAVPVHGEPRHLYEHTRLARQLQVPQAVVGHNGAVIQLIPGEAGVIGKVASGYIAVDGTTLISADSPVIKTRRRLRDEGCVVVSLVVGKDGKLLAAPQLMAPGCLDAKEDGDLLDACAEAVEAELARLREHSGDDALRDTARQAVRRLLKQELGKKPMVEIQITRI